MLEFLEREVDPLKFFNQTALSGKDNKRLYSDTPRNCESTAAWTEDEREMPKSRVEIPKTSSVEDAKEWVDNGSKL